jgi:thimet oligopeptidase
MPAPFPLSRRGPLRFAAIALLTLPAFASAQQPTKTSGSGSGSGSSSSATSAADDSLEAWRLSAPALAARCRDAVARARASADRVLAAPAAAGTALARLQAAEQVSADLQRVIALPRSLQVMSPDAAVRDTSVACDRQVTEFATGWSADPRLYALARQAQSELGTGGGNARPADRQLAKLYLESGRLAGAGLDSAARSRVVGLLRRHADLERNFSLALAGDSTSIRIPLRDTLGLDTQFRAGLARAGDSLVVRVDESTNTPFLRFERDRAARRRYYVAYDRRGGEANVARLDSALAIRDTVAHVLGFPNYAAYQLSSRMAATPDRVMALLSRLKPPLRRKAAAELASLRPLARRDGVAGPLQAWDVGYYFERLRQSRYALSQTAIQQYFPVDHVLPEVMKLYSALLGVRFEAVTPAGGWSPEVSRYTVVDSVSGRVLGRLYFDLYPRPNKFQHFADFTVVPAVALAGGARQLPWTAILGNWPLPAPGHPSLLTHSNVIVLFHEFGHAMAAVLDQSPYPTTSNYRQDFVEAPSQMLENWIWQPAILKRISRHVTTGAALPDSLINRMLAIKHLTDGNNWGQQVFYATYDMSLHTAAGAVDPTRAWFELWPQIMPYPQPTGTVPEANFGHIMGGYEAGYYAYLWAKVYSQDMFTRFSREGVLNPATGRAYRDLILAPAGTEEPDTLVRRFLGRPMSDAAFYRELGLSAEDVAGTP